MSLTELARRHNLDGPGGFTPSLTSYIEHLLSATSPRQDGIGLHLPRHYHTVDHACRVFDDSRKCGLNKPEFIKTSFLFAAYHDIVYVAGLPRSSENASLNLFLRHVYDGWLGVSPAQAALVATGILASANYGEYQANLPPEVYAWLDADLAGLAAEWHTYAETTVNVRREFFFVDDAAFAAGRIKFSDVMLARAEQNTLFYRMVERTPYARENLLRERALIESGWTVSVDGWKDASGELHVFEEPPHTPSAADRLDWDKGSDESDPPKFDAATEADLLKGLEKTVP